MASTPDPAYSVKGANKVFASLVASPAQAITEAEAEAEAEADCTIVKGGASIIMAKRQDGMLIQKLSAIMRPYFLNGASKKLFDDILRRAYQVSQYSANLQRTEVIESFGNEIYRECLNSY
jgi:hypothetical protein